MKYEIILKSAKKIKRTKLLPSSYSSSISSLLRSVDRESFGFKIDLMKITDDVFKNALSHFPSGVTVITYSHLGKHGGLTVSSFSSLSLNPPLVLFCLQKNITSHDPIYDSGKFIVNILAQGQDSISNQFASGKTDKHTLIEELKCKTGELGIPILPGILSYIECEVEQFVSGGDHSIVIGKVISAGAEDSLRPLLYYRRNYYSI